MFFKAKVCVLFICSLFLSSCVTWHPVKVLPGLNANNEIIIKSELQSLISGNKQNIKIVLRVPGAPKNITQETQKDVSKAYDRFERELSRVGFVVRDRELLEKIVSEIKPASYMELAKAIDTDLILEVLYVGPCDLSHKSYYDIQTGRMLELSNPSMELKQPGSLAFAMRGGQLDCRTITVKDGTVSGMFTLFNLPCDGICDFEVNDNKLWRIPEPNPGQAKGCGVGTDDQNFHQLADLLMQTLSSGEITVLKTQMGSLAAKNGLIVNDVIEKINGHAVYNISQALDMIVKSEGKLTLLIKRDNNEVTVSFAKKLAEKIGVELVFKPKINSQGLSASAETKPAIVTSSAAVIIPAVTTPSAPASQSQSKPVVVSSSAAVTTPAAQTATTHKQQPKTEKAKPGKLIKGLE